MHTGLTFVVIGFSDEDNFVAETIAAMNGKVVSSTFAGIPDYGVVPKCGAPLKHTVNEIVTDLFIVSIKFFIFLLMLTILIFQLIFFVGRLHKSRTNSRN